jgi:hypothetical protein
MTTITEDLLSQCIDIATKEQNHYLLRRKKGNTGSMYVTINNMPRVLNLQADRALEHIRRDFKEYTSKNNIPNYILDYEDPQTQKGRKNTAFAPAEHVLGFLRNRKSDSAIDLVKRIDDEIAKRTHSIQLRNAEDRIGTETERANEAEKRANEESKRAEQEAMRAEDEADRANLECELRVQQEAAHKRQIEALRQMPKDSQCILFTPENYNGALAGAHGRTQEHTDIKEELFEIFKKMPELFHKLDIHARYSDFEVSIRQCLTGGILNDVEKHQAKQMGEGNQLALFGAIWSGNNAAAMKLHGASTKCLRKMKESLSHFAENLEDCSDDFYKGERTREDVVREVVRQVDKLASKMESIKEISKQSNTTGRFSHNTDTYGASEMQTNIRQDHRLVDGSRVIFTIQGATKSDTMHLALPHSNMKGVEETLKPKYQAIVNVFLNDDTFVPPEKETFTEKALRKKRMYDVYEQELGLSHPGDMPREGSIDSFTRNLIFGEKCILPMHSNGATHNDLVARMSPKMLAYMKRGNNRYILDGFCRGLHIICYRSAMYKKRKIRIDFTDASNGRKRKRKRQALGDAIPLAEEEIAQATKDAENRMTKLRFRLKRWKGTRTFNKFKDEPSEPLGDFIDRCVSLVGRREAINLFHWLENKVGKEDNSWFEAMPNAEYIGNRENDTREFIANVQRLVDAWNKYPCSKPKNVRDLSKLQAEVEEGIKRDSELVDVRKKIVDVIKADLEYKPPGDKYDKKLDPGKIWEFKHKLRDAGRDTPGMLEYVECMYGKMKSAYRFNRMRNCCAEAIEKTQTTLDGIPHIWIPFLKSAEKKTGEDFVKKFESDMCAMRKVYISAIMSTRTPVSSIPASWLAFLNEGDLNEAWEQYRRGTV